MRRLSPDRLSVIKEIRKSSAKRDRKVRPREEYLRSEIA